MSTANDLAAIASDYQSAADHWRAQAVVAQARGAVWDALEASRKAEKYRKLARQNAVIEIDVVWESEAA